VTSTCTCVRPGRTPAGALPDGDAPDVGLVDLGDRVHRLRRAELENARGADALAGAGVDVEHATVDRRAHLRQAALGLGARDLRLEHGHLGAPLVAARVRFDLAPAELQAPVVLAAGVGELGVLLLHDGALQLGGIERREQLALLHQITAVDEELLDDRDRERGTGDVAHAVFRLEPAKGGDAACGGQPDLGIGNGSRQGRGCVGMDRRGQCRGGDDEDGERAAPHPPHHCVERSRGGHPNRRYRGPPDGSNRSSGSARRPATRWYACVRLVVRK